MVARETPKICKYTFGYSFVLSNFQVSRNVFHVKFSIHKLLSHLWLWHILILAHILDTIYTLEVYILCSSRNWSVEAWQHCWDKRKYRYVNVLYTKFVWNFKRPNCHNKVNLVRLHNDKINATQLHVWTLWKSVRDTSGSADRCFLRSNVRIRVWHRQRPAS